MRVLPLSFLLIALAVPLASQAPARARTFTGTITDDMCGADGHAIMRMGPTDGECARMCVLAHGGRFVLLDGKKVYGLSDQVTAEKLAGERVRVVGRLDAAGKAIDVTSMAVVPPRR